MTDVLDLLGIVVYRFVVVLKKADDQTNLKLKMRLKCEKWVSLRVGSPSERKKAVVYHISSASPNSFPKFVNNGARRLRFGHQQKRIKRKFTTVFSVKWALT